MNAIATLRSRFGLIQSERIPSDNPTQGAEKRRPTRTVEDQELMFGQNGFCYDGAADVQAEAASEQL